MLKEISKFPREVYRRCVSNIWRLIFFTPTIKSQSTDYDEYWKNKKNRNQLGLANPFQKKRGGWIASRIKNNTSILDVGCGDGAVLNEIRQYKSVSCIGTDVSDYILTFLSSQNIKAVKFDFNNSEETHSLPEADYILMLEVLEHMQDAESFLEKMFCKAKKGIYFSVPNTGFLPWRLRFIFRGRFPVQWISHPGEHLRFWTYRDMVWWLEQLKYENFTIHAYEGIPILSKIWPSVFAQGLVVEILKDDER